jgi:hypothetical protein
MYLTGRAFSLPKPPDAVFAQRPRSDETELASSLADREPAGSRRAGSAGAWRLREATRGQPLCRPVPSDLAAGREEARHRSRKDEGAFRKGERVQRRRKLASDRVLRRVRFR